MVTWLQISFNYDIFYKKLQQITESIKKNYNHNLGLPLCEGLAFDFPRSGGCRNGYFACTQGLQCLPKTGRISLKEPNPLCTKCSMGSSLERRKGCGCDK